MATVYLGLGANEGNRENFIQNAIQQLKAKGLTVEQCSAIIETDPVDCPTPQTKYLNCAIKATTELSPEDLLERVQSVENLLGRTRPFRYAPRTIDIDILLYDDISIQTDALTIPHPGIKRDFVMRPLLEIYPDFTL